MEFLTLDGEGGLSCFLGMQSAQIYFLPGIGEGHRPLARTLPGARGPITQSPTTRGKRRAGIAPRDADARRSSRCSRAPNLHFRFEPGRHAHRAKLTRT